MRKLKMRMVFLPAIALAAVQVLQAQDDCGDECRINSNVAMVINVQVNASAQAVGAGWGIAGESDITSIAVTPLSVSLCGTGFILREGL